DAIIHQALQFIADGLEGNNVHRAGRVYDDCGLADPVLLRRRQDLPACSKATVGAVPRFNALRALLAELPPLVTPVSRRVVGALYLAGDMAGQLSDRGGERGGLAGDTLPLDVLVGHVAGVGGGV